MRKTIEVSASQYLLGIVCPNKDVDTMVYISVMHISGAITKEFICKINQSITNNPSNSGEDFFLPAKVIEGYRFYQAVWQRLPKCVSSPSIINVSSFSLTINNLN